MANAEDPEFHFGDDYREEYILNDGRRIVLRPVRPADKVKLREGLKRLSPDSRYRRFFTQKDHFTEAELRYLTEVDGVDHFAIGAAWFDEEDEEGEGLGLGVARFVRLDEWPEAAEAAIAVADDAQGVGLGRRMFIRLCQAARERGVEWFRCEVLSDNEPMRRLIDSVSDDVRRGFDGDVVVLDIKIPDISLEESESPPEGSMYQLFRAAAEGTFSVRRALERVLERLRDLKQKAEARAASLRYDSKDEPSDDG
ncbi:MAG: GNAT family N-acetyltransferase [Myxococcota bacterium]